jgi:transcription-repair coupling factor (superfamily II helicase)
LYVGEHQWEDLPFPHPSLDVLICKQGPAEGLNLCLPTPSTQTEPSDAPQGGVVLLTDTELFGRQRVRRSHVDTGRAGKTKSDVDAIQSLSELRTGDYVVHVKHGIGQFVELSQIVFENECREYLTIQYRGNDKLFVPVDQLHLLSRYRGAGDSPPNLSKMGGQEWQKVTKKVKESIATIAKELVALYKIRQNVPGHAFEPDTPWQVEMEEAFPYEETPDQWKAICDVKQDMEVTKPMDRLICGDVGFGKTEVAMRAVFKSIMGGRQAAVLVPTTILAQQHYTNFSQRLQPWGVRVGLMSRFRSVKEQRELLVKLKAGELDVLVGTHRILQKDIQFKELGLLVIDEEHRFGVTHKERIKQLRTNVDVLTMSATPIPRTLYMSLSGVREMSLINTPPTNRLPVQTLVGAYNPAQLRRAILQEVDRGGQVFYMHNRVQSIYGVAEQLQHLIPEVRIAVAHGQLAPTDLETIMLDFSNHAYDVLVSTTIIESGVDIPNANTLIVDDADRYGLAQLYQIRGRVGRSDAQAYAYFYYQPDKQLTDDAKQRLRAIREFTSLGSGYHIAMRDMEIRGVGNILGAEQHGHMIQIGFDLYCEMLNQAVDAAHEGQDFSQIEEVEPSVIDLNVTAFLPTAYVGSQDVKLNEYKRLARIQSLNQLEVIESEWQDRFGVIPEEAKQLVRLARLRIIATQLNVTLVRSDDEMLRLAVPYPLQEWMSLQPKLPYGLGNKLRWMAPVKSNSQHAQPTLMYKHMGASSNALLNVVEQLFEALLCYRTHGLEGVHQQFASKVEAAPASSTAAVGSKRGAKTKPSSLAQATKNAVPQYAEPPPFRPSGGLIAERLNLGGAEALEPNNSDRSAGLGKPGNLYGGNAEAQRKAEALAKAEARAKARQQYFR